MQRESPTDKLENREPDRRRAPRAVADLPITLTLAGGKCEARIRDISRSGVCFFLDRPIALMTVLQMSLPLRTAKGTRNVIGHGAVVRCEKISKALDHYEIAVFLHEMGDADRHLVEEFVGSGLAGDGPKTTQARA